MSHHTKFHVTLPALSVAVLLVAASAPLHAQVEGPQSTRILVRADIKGNAPTFLRPQDVSAELGGKPLQLSSFTALQQAPGLSGRNGSQDVEVALLIDDGLRGNFDVNLPEVEQFIGNLTGPSTSVGVGYMRNGTAYFPAGFSKQSEVELKAVRLPISVGGINGSPYFCVQDLVKHWPTQTGAARVILMITNGIDRYNGSVSPLNQDSPYVDQAIQDAQKAAVPVYSIYFGGRAINGTFGSFSGQGYLGKMADETGGILFNQGTINPPTLAPFFHEFQQALSHTYAATFLDNDRKLQRFKVKSSVSDVKLHAQSQVQAGISPGAGLARE